MSYSSIELKSTQYTLTLVMDPSSTFETILTDVRKKFVSSARFFRGAQMALEFSGKKLTDAEQSAIVQAITQSCSLEIICILERDEEAERAQYTAITKVLKELPPEASARDLSTQGGAKSSDVKSAGPENGGYADVLCGTVKNGQKVLSDRSVLILGDVEPLAQVSCAGSIFVAGCALGTLRAGLGTDEHSFAGALVLKPQNLEVCGHKSISGIRKKTMDDSYTISPQAAFVEDGHLKMSGISGKMWSHLFQRLQVKAEDDSTDH